MENTIFEEGNKCEICLNSRPIISENGYHAICCLSIKKARDCCFGYKYYYIRDPRYKGELDEQDVL